MPEDSDALPQPYAPQERNVLEEWPAAAALEQESREPRWSQSRQYEESWRPLAPYPLVRCQPVHLCQS